VVEDKHLAFSASQFAFRLGIGLDIYNVLFMLSVRL